MTQRVVKTKERLTEFLETEIVLSGDVVVLEPMKRHHEQGLIESASQGQLWNLEYTQVPTPKTMGRMIQQALENRAKRTEYPFVVKLRSSGRIVGTTRYYWIRPENRNLSIGYTWYGQDVHRTAVNTEAKFLLLNHCFDDMECISVQWHTDHRNKRSQQALLRLGAKLEGILRNDRVLPDGVVRHTHCFSMLDTEWPQALDFLRSRLDYYKEKSSEALV